MGVLEDLGAQLPPAPVPPASVLPPAPAQPAAPVTSDAQAAPPAPAQPQVLAAEMGGDTGSAWKGIFDNPIYNNTIGAVIGGVRSESQTAKTFGLGYQTDAQKKMEDEFASVPLMHPDAASQQQAYNEIIAKYKTQGVYDEEYARNARAAAIQAAPKEGTYEAKQLQDRNEFSRQLDEKYGTVLRGQESLDPVQASTALQFKETALAKFDQLYGRMAGADAGPAGAKKAEEYRQFLFSQYLPAVISDSSEMLKRTMDNGGDSRKSYADLRSEREDAWAALNLKRNEMSDMITSYKADFDELGSGTLTGIGKGALTVLGGAMNRISNTIERPFQYLGMYDVFEDFRNEAAIDPNSSFVSKALQSVRKDAEEVWDAAPQLATMALGTKGIDKLARLGKLAEIVEGAGQVTGASRLSYLAGMSRAGLAEVIRDVAPTIAGQAFLGRSYTPQEMIDNGWGTLGSSMLSAAMFRPIKAADMSKWVSERAGELPPEGSVPPTAVSARVAQLAEDGDVMGAAAVKHAAESKLIDEPSDVSVSALSPKAKENIRQADALRSEAVAKANAAAQSGTAAPDFDTLAFSDRLKKTVENPGGNAKETAMLDAQRRQAEAIVRSQYADPNTLPQDMAAYDQLKAKWDSLSQEARQQVGARTADAISSALARKPGEGGVVENPNRARALETLKLAEELPGGIPAGTAVGQFFKGDDGLWHSYFQTKDVNGKVLGGYSDLSKMFKDVAEARGGTAGKVGRANGALAEKLKPLFGRLSRNDLRVTDNEFALLSEAYGKDMLKLWRKEGMGYVPTDTLTKILTPSQAKAMVSDLADESKGRRAVRDADAAASFVNAFGEKTVTATVDDLFSKEARSDKPMHRVQDALQGLLNDKKNPTLQAAAQGAIDAVGEAWRAGDRTAFIRARAAATEANVKLSSADLSEMTPEIAKRVVASQVRAAAYGDASFLDPLARDPRKSAGIFESAEASVRETVVTPDEFFADADVARAVKRFFAKHIDNVEFILGGVSAKGDDILGSFHSAKDKSLKSSLTAFKQAIADGRTPKEASELMSKTGLHEIMHQLHQYAAPEELKAMKLEYGRRLEIEANHVADQLVIEGDLVGTPISREAAVSRARKELMSGERGHKWTSWEENAADYMSERFFDMAKEGSFAEYAPGAKALWSKIVRFFKELFSFSEDLGKNYDRFLRNVMQDAVNGRARKWNDALNGEKFSSAGRETVPNAPPAGLDEAVLVAALTPEALQAAVFKRMEELEAPDTFGNPDAMALYETLAYLSRPSESARLFDELAGARDGGTSAAATVSDALSRNHPASVTREAVRERKTMELKRLVAQKAKELDEKGWAAAGKDRALVALPGRFVAPSGESFGRGAVGAGTDALLPRMFDAALVRGKEVHIVTSDIDGKVSTDVIKTGEGFTYGPQPVAGKVNVISPSALAASGLRDAGFDGYATIGAKDAPLWAAAIQDGLLLPFDVEAAKGGIQAASHAIGQVQPFLENLSGYRTGDRVAYELTPGRRAPLSGMEAGVVGAMESEKAAAEAMMAAADTLGDADAPSFKYDAYAHGKRIDSASMFMELPKVLGSPEPVAPAAAIASLSSFGRMGETMRSAFRAAAKAGGWGAETAKPLANASELFTRRNGHARLMREAMSAADDGAKLFARQVIGEAKNKNMTLLDAADRYADALMASYALQGAMDAGDFRRRMGGVLAAAAEDKAYGLRQLAPLYRTEWFRAAFGTPWIRAQREAGAQALHAAGLASKAAEVDSRMARAISVDPWRQDGALLPMAAFAVLKRMGLFPLDLTWSSARARVSGGTLRKLEGSLRDNANYLMMDPDASRMAGYLSSLETFVKEISRTEGADAKLSEGDLAKALDAGAPRHLSDELSGFPDQFSALREGWGELVARRYSLADVAGELASGSRWMEREPAFGVPHNTNLRAKEYSSRFAKVAEGASERDVFETVLGKGVTWPEIDKAVRPFSTAASFVRKGGRDGSGAFDLLRESAFAEFGAEDLAQFTKRGNLEMSVLDKDGKYMASVRGDVKAKDLAYALQRAASEAAKRDGTVAEVASQGAAGALEFSRKDLDGHPVFRAFFNDAAKLDPDGAKRAEAGGTLAKAEWLAGKMSATAAAKAAEFDLESAKRMKKARAGDLDEKGQKALAARLKWGSPDAQLANALWNLADELRKDSGIAMARSSMRPKATVGALLRDGKAEGVVAFWSPKARRVEIEGAEGTEVRYDYAGTAEDGRWFMEGEDVRQEGAQSIDSATVEDFAANAGVTYLDLPALNRAFGDTMTLKYAAEILPDGSAKITPFISGDGGFNPKVDSAAKPFTLSTEELTDGNRDIAEIVGNRIAGLPDEGMPRIKPAARTFSQDVDAWVSETGKPAREFLAERVADESAAAKENDCI